MAIGSARLTQDGSAPPAFTASVSHPMAAAMTVAPIISRWRPSRGASAMDAPLVSARADREGHAGQPGAERVATGPKLQIDDEDQEERRDRREEHEGDQPARSERWAGEQAQRDERHVTTSLDTPLPGDEQRCHRDRAEHERQRPGRPTQLAPVHQRIEQRCQRGGAERHPDKVQPWPTARA